MIDKLAVEFATELNNLGVRVAKLEAGASSIKFSGDARVRYTQTYAQTGATSANVTWPNSAGTRESATLDRFRLNMTANVNDDTTFNGRIGTIQTYTGFNPTVYVLDMNFVSKNVFNTGITTTIGRQDVNIGPSTYFLATTGMVDAAKASFNIDKVNVEAGYGDFSQINVTSGCWGIVAPGMSAPNGVAYSAGYNFTKAVWANVKAPVGAFNLSLGYFDDVSNTEPFTGVAAKTNLLKVTDLGVVVPVMTNVKALAEYWVNDANNGPVMGKPRAYVYRLAYKGVDPKVAGSFGAFVEYYNCQNGATSLNGVSDVQTGNIVNFQNNQEAWDVVAQFALAKNITLDAIQTFDTATSSTGVQAANTTRAEVNFFF
jgi:hypothetical protein